MDRAIVIDTGSMYRLKNDDAAFKMISKQGFKYYDYTLYWKKVCDHIGVGPNCRKNAKKTKELGEKYGLACRQTHATFLNASDKAGINQQIKLIKLEIELSKILGAKGVVIHPHPFFSIEENAKLFKKEFLPLAIKYDINLLIENTFNWDQKLFDTCTSKPKNFLKLLQLINDKHVGACVDIGHAALKGLGTSPAEMLKTLGSYVYALHIHDNDTYGDNHQMPYTNQINFAEVLDALVDINYQGDITFEILTCYNRGYNRAMELPLELYPAFVKLEYEIGKYFADYLDK